MKLVVAVPIKKVKRNGKSTMEVVSGKPIVFNVPDLFVTESESDIITEKTLNHFKIFQLQEEDIVEATRPADVIRRLNKEIKA
jgi:hypothetical protein